MRRSVRSILVAIVAAATATAVAAPVGAAASSTIVVRPGQSIQAAVDKASPGDTVLVQAGTYHQNVVIQKNAITLRADGRVTLSAPAAKKGFCDFGTDTIGICVVPADIDPASGTFTRRVRDVRIDGFRVVGFGGFGVFGFGTAGLRIARITAVDNDVYGIANFDGVGTSLTRSSATGSEEAGLYVGDSPNAHTVVSGNVSSNNRYGLLLRHNHFVTAQNNVLFGNCLGAFLVDDGQKEGSGDQNVHDNVVTSNNKLCPADEEEGIPAQSGGGIVLWGSVHNVIRHNAVLGNRGATRDSGGVVLRVSPFSHIGSNDNLVADNVIRRNQPFDIVKDAGSTGNTFRGNDCGTSRPSGLC